MENVKYDSLGHGGYAGPAVKIPTFATLLGRLEELEKALAQNDSIAADLSGRVSGSSPRAANTVAGQNRSSALLSNFDTCISSCLEAAQSTYRELDRLRTVLG